MLDDSVIHRAFLTYLRYKDINSSANNHTIYNKDIDKI